MVIELKDTLAMTTTYLVLRSDVENPKLVLLLFLVVFRTLVLLFILSSVVFRLLLFLLKAFGRFFPTGVIFVLFVNHISASLFIATVVVVISAAS